MATKKTAPQKYATHITTPAGKRVYVSGRTKEELDEKIFRARVEMRAGVDITDETLFSDYAKAWLPIYKKAMIRPSSYAILETQLNTHVLPFFDGLRIKDIRPTDVQLFLNNIAPYSKSLQTKCFGLLRNILTAAVEDGLIVKSPIRKDMGISAEEPEEEEPLTDEQAQRLLTALEGTRAYTFCLIALATGMRRGEIIGLMWDDIDFDKRIITVTHNKSFEMNKPDAPVTELLKTEAAHRNLPMSQHLTEHLLSLKETSTSPFVVCMSNGESLSKSAFRSLWSNVERRTVGKGRTPRELGETYGGVKVILDFDVHPHQLRHTYITKLFEKGLDLKQVQYLAGHKKPEMTLRIYTHYRNKQRAAETHTQVCTALDYLAPASVATTA
jgi:integrase